MENIVDERIIWGNSGQKEANAMVAKIPDLSLYYKTVIFHSASKEEV